MKLYPIIILFLLAASCNKKGADEDGFVVIPSVDTMALLTNTQWWEYAYGVDTNKDGIVDAEWIKPLTEKEVWSFYRNGVVYDTVFESGIFYVDSGAWNFPTTSRSIFNCRLTPGGFYGLVTLQFEIYSITDTSLVAFERNFKMRWAVFKKYKH